ncbi:GTPase family protein [Huintestinicola sp.]|uniref:GTPase family protein n=1 Tax=Huintestinicola sp. TaxID=2981661 RepID=UPI003D7C8BA8
MTNTSVFDRLTDIVMNSRASEAEKKEALRNIMELKGKQINVLITGSTGCGKSSTINALFNTEKAKVGASPDPETMTIEKYELDNLTLWDSPGLGDGKEADNRHAQNIIRKLNELDKDGNPLIDIVLVILDGGSRDLGTSYQLINEVIIPNIGKGMTNRILVAINQADMAMKGRYWNAEENRPEKPLEDFLKEKAESVKRRIYEATGVTVEPIYYCAGYKEEGLPQQPPYNLSKLLSYIVTNTPSEKRICYADNINKEPEMWKHDDRLDDYKEIVRSSMLESIVGSAREGSEIGEEIGSCFGTVGGIIGKIGGGIIGGIIGLGKSLLSGLFG